MKSVSLLVCSVLFCCRVFFFQPNCQRAWRWQTCCWHECRLIHPHACLFVSRTPLPIHLVILTWHGDNLWNIKLDRIWFADSCGKEKKVMSTTGSHKSRKKIKPPGRRENTELASLCCEAETAEREEQGGKRFFSFFLKKALVLFSHLCFKLWKESLSNIFCEIKQHLRNIFSPARRIHTRCSHLTWKHRLVIFNLGYCECETLYPAAVWFTARDFSTQTETHTAAAEAKIELVWAFLGCLKHRTCLWPLRFNKDYKTHAEKPLLCSGASSPYASSQSRGDVSRSTNVNIAARVGELSNTLTHNLFQLTLTQCECVITCIPKMPSAPSSFLNAGHSSSIVCAPTNTHIQPHMLENLRFPCTFFKIISDMWQNWKKKKSNSHMQDFIAVCFKAWCFLSQPMRSFLSVNRF